MLTRVYRGISADKIFQRDACVFNCFVGDLQKHALLGVHGNRFKRRGVKERVVELVDGVVVQHICILDICESLPGSTFRVVEPLDVEPRYSALDVFGGGKHIPKF